MPDDTAGTRARLLRIEWPVEVGLC